MSDDKKPIDAIANAVVGLSANQFESLLERVGQTNALAMRQSLRRENPDYSEVSVFTNPKGERFDPKQALAQPVFFCGARCREEQLTPEEIALFNRFTSDKTARGGSWTAQLRHDGRGSALVINVPATTIDQRMSLPSSLSLILLELLDGEDAVNTVTMHKRIQDLEAQLKAQKPLAALGASPAR